MHRESPVSAFGALTVPLSSSAMSHETDSPDLPQLVGMANPMLAAAPILDLGAAIAMLIAGRAISPITGCCRRPYGWDPAAGVPPPRFGPNLHHQIT